MKHSSPDERASWVSLRLSDARRYARGRLTVDKRDRRRAVVDAASVQLQAVGALGHYVGGAARRVIAKARRAGRARMGACTRAHVVSLGKAHA